MTAMSWHTQRADRERIVQPLNQVYRAIGDGVSLAIKALALLREGDSENAVDGLIETQLAAESRFRREAYAAWTGHDIISGILSGRKLGRFDRT
jgi:hypothetical protein